MMRTCKNKKLHIQRLEVGGQFFCTQNKAGAIISWNDKLTENKIL